MGVYEISIAPLLILVCGLQLEAATQNFNSNKVSNDWATLAQGFTEREDCTEENNSREASSVLILFLNAHRWSNTTE